MIRAIDARSMARHFTLTVFLSTQVYKRVSAILMLGVTLQKGLLEPIQGGIQILLVPLCYGNRGKLRSDGPLSSHADA